MRKEKKINKKKTRKGKRGEQKEEVKNRIRELFRSEGEEGRRKRR